MTTEDWNPALEPPDPSAPVEKQYKNIGNSVVFDHEPGEVFTATLTKAQEEALTEFGTLEVVVEDAPQEPVQSTGGETTAEESTPPVEVQEEATTPEPEVKE